MADYIVDTAERGKVRVTLPSPPAEQTALHAALAKEIKEGRGEAIPASPEAQSLMQRISSGVSGAMGALAEGVERNWREGMTATPAHQIYAGMMGQPTPEAPPSNAFTQGVARTIIPQNLTEIGIMAGTAGVGGMAAKAGMTGLKASLMRVLGGTAGGTVGGAADDQAAAGAVMGAVGGGLGEGVGLALDRLLKAGSSRVRKLVEKIAADAFGSRLDEIPELRSFIVQNGQVVGRGENVFAGRTTTESLRDLTMGDARTSGRAILGAQQQEVTQAIEGLLPPGSNGMVHDPLDATGKTFLPYVKAKERLGLLYDAAYGRAKQADPLTSTIRGLDPKRAYADAIDMMRKDLDGLDKTGQAAALFDAAQDQFRVGITLLQSLRPAFRKKDADRIAFDVNAVRNVFSDKQAMLAKKLGVQNYDAIREALFFGERPGLADAPLGIGTGFGVFGGLSNPHVYGSHLERFMRGPNLVGKPLDMGPLGRTAVTVGTERTAPLLKETLGY